MNEPTKLGNIKMLLFEEVQRLEKQQKNIAEEKQILETNISILSSIVKDLSLTDYEEILSNSEAYSLLFEMVYSNEESIILNDKIKFLLYKLLYYSKNEDAYYNEINELKKSLIDVKNKIENDLKKMSQTVNYLNTIDDSYYIKNYRSILSSIKFKNNLITPVQLKLVENLLEQNNYSDKEQIRSLELIKNINISIMISKPNNFAKRYDNYTIFQMLDMGYEQLDDIYIENADSRNKCKSIIKGFKTAILDKNIDDELIMDNLPSLNNDYTYDEFYYIVSSLLKELIYQMSYYSTMLSNDKDYYDDIALREEIKESFKFYKNRYILIREYFNNEIDNYKQTNSDAENDINVDANNLFYARSDNNNESYIEKDIKDIPEENLSKILELLSKLKQDSLSKLETKQLKGNNNFRDMLEIKSDQIRIIYYHINNNNYIIVGCMLKKSDNDIAAYRVMCSRDKYINIKTDELFNKEKEKSIEIEKSLEDYININKRKGSR